MKKQTAVEWLYNQLVDTVFKEKVTKDILEQAKQMEKEQMEKMYEYAMLSIIDMGHGENFDEYYNKTFTSTPQT